MLQDELLLEAPQPDRAFIGFLVHDASSVVLGALEMSSILAEMSALSQLKVTRSTQNLHHPVAPRRSTLDRKIGSLKKSRAAHLLLEALPKTHFEWPSRVQIAVDHSVEASTTYPVADWCRTAMADETRLAALLLG